MGGYTAADFLKKSKTKEPAKKDKEDAPKAKPRPAQTAENNDIEERMDAALAKKAEKPLFAKDEEVNAKSVMAKLGEILAARGRKGTSAADQMSLLIRLRQVCLIIFVLKLIHSIGGCSCQAHSCLGNQGPASDHCRPF